MKDGGPAFPFNRIVVHPVTGMQMVREQFNGMSLRDWFAGMTLQGMMADPTVQGATEEDLARYSNYCYRMADVMLTEREKS